MQIALEGNLPQSSDLEQIGRTLPLDGVQLLELGCGAAQTTRALAESFAVDRIIAMEVDRIQHEKNLLIEDLPNVSFVYGGAQETGLADASVDAVIMLKSLHHVPTADMDAAFAEILRVLRPGGLAYISEPVYAGPFNEILRLFNDEKKVRQAAFDAICRTVDSGHMELVEELHFCNKSVFQGFGEFEQRIMGATHSSFDIDAELHARIKAAFIPHVGDDGTAEFLNPLRMDLLRKPV